MATARKAPVNKAPATKAPAKRAGAKPAAKQSRTSHVSVKPDAQRATAKRVVAKPAAKQPASTASKSSASHVSVKPAPAQRRAADPKSGVAPAKPAAVKETRASAIVKEEPGKPPPPATTSVRRSTSTFGMPTMSFELPEPRGVSKDGIAYTKDFDVKFLKAQRDLLDEAKARLMGQAVRLEDEANSLIEEAEMGDVQFDDEGGEGDTMVVERERDLALSAQARQTIADIDEALLRLTKGTYGYSAASGRLIPRERLEAIPWATELVEEKVGGIGRR